MHWAFFVFPWSSYGYEMCLSLAVKYYNLSNDLLENYTFYESLPHWRLSRGSVNGCGMCCFFILSTPCECGLCVRNHIFYLKGVYIAPLAAFIHRVTHHVIKPVENSGYESKDYIKSKENNTFPALSQKGGTRILQTSPGTPDSEPFYLRLWEMQEFKSGSEESPL